MQSIDTDQSLDDYNEQSSNIQPRLCTLHRWSHYNGYGILLSRIKHPLGLRIDHIESNSPAESAGLRRDDIILSVNGHCIENDDFSVILSCIQYALEQEQIRFLVIDSNSAELAQHYHIKINENSDYCIRIETSRFADSPHELRTNQCNRTIGLDQEVTQNSFHDELNDPNKLSSDMDLDNTLKPELRMCSVTLQSSNDSIGISLEPDTDFGHIITEVDADSPAALGGIESNDHIISLNHTSLIYLPFADVLYFLKKKRQDIKLDFLVAKKSYLLQSSPKESTSNTNGEIIAPLNVGDKNKSFTLPSRQTFEQIYHKTNYERNQQREVLSTITDEQYDRLSLQIYTNRYTAKHKKKHGNVHRGIGPATAQRYSWSVRNEKISDYSSVRSNLYGRRSGTNETMKRGSSLKMSLKLLQVGFTNPSPTLQARPIRTREPSLTSSDDGNRTAQSSTSIARRQRTSPKGLPSPNLAMKNHRANHISSPSSLKHGQTIRTILTATPGQPLSTWRNKEQDNSHPSQSNLQLITTPISELSNHGYELHHIKLMQTTDTIPLGFKLSEQTDSAQCVVAGVEQQSRADIAGLKIDDWLIKIEDNDIRLTEFLNISENIYRILNTVGFVNILIARKKSTASPSVTNDQQTSPRGTRDKLNERNILLSVGLSNQIEDQSSNQSRQQDYAMIPSSDDSKDQVRHIILNEALGIDFYSFAPDQNSHIKIHAISNVRPLSLAYRAGLRDGDCILTVNHIDVTNTTHKTVRYRLLKKSPVHLTVINDPKYLELIETIKRNQNRIRLSSSTSLNDHSIEQQQQQQPNLLSEDLINVLFIDDQGPVYMKHCLLKKEPAYQSMGFTLQYTDNYHIIDEVDINMPAYNCGLREEDVLLYINMQNVEQMTHDDVIILLRTLTLSNEVFHLVLLRRNDMQRYKHYQEKGFIDWKRILSEINEDHTHQAQQRLSYVNSLSNKPSEPSTSSLLSGARICILVPSVGRPAGFSISGEETPPFIISRIDKDTPAERAGLQLNDALLSINGKSLIHATYDETIQIIKQALEQKVVQIVVNQQPSSVKQERRDSNQSSLSDSSEESADDKAGSVGNNTKVEKRSERGTDAIQAYQRQRNRELAYTLRLCHLNTTNSDGQPTSTFGFDITKEAKYEYPMISQVEPKLPGERSGLQARDLLLKVNGRKTKGVDIAKVKKAIEKAKYDNRLELLVVDEEIYRHCTSTNKKFKEPFIKVKHIFPKSRSSISFESLDSIAARASVTSQEIVEQLTNGSVFEVHRLSIPKEVALEHEDGLTPSTCEETIKSEIPSSINLRSQQKYMFATNQDVSNISQELPNETSTNESIVDSVMNTINNFFPNNDSETTIKPDYDIPSQIIGSKTLVPLSPTVHFEQTLFEDIQHGSRLGHTVRSNRSSGLYDYISDPRRCLLKIDRSKGLGFILSATGDYDHTITAVEKNSIADIAGLQVHDELIEINDVDVRNIKYEQVIQMLFSAMETQNSIELCVTNGHLNDLVSSTTTDRMKSENVVDNHGITTTPITSVFDDAIWHKNSPVNHLKQPTMNTSHPELSDQSKHLKYVKKDGRSGSVPTLSTGITASPKDLRVKSNTVTSPQKVSDDKILEISKKDAPIARLCRIRKFPSSPFYGFFLCGNPKRLGRVHVSDIKKNSSAAICGLRNGDRIIEINGINIQTLTYETILNKIKLHMERRDLELLVLDKKSLRWYHERNYPVTSQTLPTIVHIEPVINNMNVGTQTYDKYTRISSFIDPQESTTNL